jgi:hypothetical protein
MLVVHANWVHEALHLWAESLEACVRMSEHGHGGPGDQHPPASGAVSAPSTIAASTPPHPFAAEPDDLKTVLADAALRNGELAAYDAHELRLPADDTGPRPSDRLAGVVSKPIDDEPLRLDTFSIPGLRIRPDRTISTLLALEDAGPPEGVEFGRSLIYWMRVARFVLELLADQRFIPTLIHSRDSELKAAWQPWLHDDDSRVRAGTLISCMPPVVRATIDVHGGRPWSILESAMSTLTDATVRRVLIEDDFPDAIEDRDPAADAHVAWLAGLLDEPTRVAPPPDAETEMIRDVRGWISGLDDTGQDQPMRLGFALHEPPEEHLPGDLQPLGEKVHWRLSMHLISGTDDSVIIDAEQLWRDPTTAMFAAGEGVRHPEEVLLAELERAARIYPALKSALTEAAPDAVELTTAEAYELLSEYRELLEESGFTVSVPTWWGKPSARLAARLQIDAPDLEPGSSLALGSATAGKSLLGLRSLVDYRWQVAVGEQPLTMDEFKALASAGGGGSLVRLHGKWLEIQPEQLKDAAAFFEAQPGGQMTLLDAIQLAYGAGGEKLGLPVFGLDATGWVAELLNASSGDARMPRFAQPTEFIGTLRPYQTVGLSWLLFLDQFGLGACLADDMGLGKTIQLIALLLAEREHGGGGRPSAPRCWSCPTSVVATGSGRSTASRRSCRSTCTTGRTVPGDLFVSAAPKQ